MRLRCRRPNPVYGDEYRLLREALLEARRRAGLSQRDLAERLGKSHSHVARIECGQRRVDTLEFYHIARAIGVDPASLFDEVIRRLDAHGAAASRAA